MSQTTPIDAVTREPQPPEGSLLEFLTPLAGAWRRLTLLPLLAGVIAVGVSYLVPPRFQASTTLLSQQQQSSAAASALASLGALGALSGLPIGGRNSADMFVSLMQSVNATDRIIDRFELIRVYGMEQRWQARRELLNNTRIEVGKKDGLITVSVLDKVPVRAAEMANQYVLELRRLTSELALTEAQERRAFFEAQLLLSKTRLSEAQAALQASGFTVEALKAEPKAAADSYAKLRAELTSAEVRLQALRGTFAEGAQEVRTLQDTVIALRSQLARNEATSPVSVGPDYVSKYREYKYQETLFELMARQFELARVDESREGASIQVVDTATPPEHKASPKRSLYGILTTVVAFLLLALWTGLRAWVRHAQHEDPAAYARWRNFVAAFGSRGREPQPPASVPGGS